MDTVWFDALWEASGADTFAGMLPRDLYTGGGDAVPEAGALLRTLGGESVLTRLRTCLFDAADGALGLMGRMCGVLVLFAVWKKYRTAVRGDDGDLFSGCVTLVLALLGFRAFADLLLPAKAYFSGIHTMVTTAVTTLTALSVMRGAVGMAAVTGGGMALFLAFMETVSAGMLFPFLRICAGLSLASCTGGTGLSGISGLLRRQFLWLVGALMMVLCAVLSYQTVLAHAADSVAMRAVKFTLSGAVPIIGGAVGEAAATVAAGFSLTRKTVGVLGIAAVLWQLLPTLCTVLLTRLAFSVSAAAAALLGMSREEGVLGECASLTGFLLAVCVISAILYILMLTLCISGG